MGVIVREQDIQPNEAAPRLRLRDMVASITGATGLFLALLWVAGRAYASGYFGAMNIPSYQVTFTPWEYADVGWIPVVIYCFGITLSAVFGGLLLELLWGILWLVVQLVWGPVRLALRAISGIIEPIYTRLVGDRLENIKLPDWMSRLLHWLHGIFSRVIKRQLPRLRYWFQLFVLIIAPLAWVILAIVLTLKFVSLWGEAEGKRTVLQGASQLELISNIPLLLDMAAPPPSASGSAPTPFVYRGYRLLTYNSGKYYFFKDLDPSTCKPKQVYIVDEKQFIQVNELPASPIVSPCASATSQNATTQSLTPALPSR